MVWKERNASHSTNTKWISYFGFFIFNTSLPKTASFLFFFLSRSQNGGQHNLRICFFLYGVGYFFIFFLYPSSSSISQVVVDLWLTSVDAVISSCLNFARPRYCTRLTRGRAPHWANSFRSHHCNEFCSGQRG